MPWESEEEAKQTGRDWSKILWILLAVIVVGGVAAMFMPKPRVNAVTEARVKHILIKIDARTAEAAQAALDEANALRERIQRGESFAKLAEQYSDDPSSNTRGGDLGWVTRGDLVDAVDNFIWRANIGEVSNVILTSYGLHLVVVTERHFSDAERYEQELKDRVLEGGVTEEPAAQ